MKMIPKIKIEYSGGYPNLCSGILAVVVDGKRWRFPDYCLSSGGSVWFDDDWNEHVEEGPWSISEYPEGFPKELKDAVEEAVNEQVPHGCCGGCV